MRGTESSSDCSIPYMQRDNLSDVYNTHQAFIDTPFSLMYSIGWFESMIPLTKGFYEAGIIKWYSIHCK